MTEFHSCYHIYSSQVIGHSTTIMFSTCIVLLYALKAHVELHIFLYLVYRKVEYTTALKLYST